MAKKEETAADQTLTPTQKAILALQKALETPGGFAAPRAIDQLNDFKDLILKSVKAGASPARIVNVINAADESFDFKESLVRDFIIEHTPELKAKRDAKKAAAQAKKDAEKKAASTPKK